MFMPVGGDVLFGIFISEVVACWVSQYGASANQRKWILEVAVVGGASFQFMVHSCRQYYL